MSYPSVIKLLNSHHHIQFEECFEGNNALDFQLVSYLGYLMKNNELDDTEYLIMSNDTGFDPVVNFWKTRNVSIRRINVNYCKSQINKKNNSSQSIDVIEKEPFVEINEVLSEVNVPIETLEQSNEIKYSYDKDEVDTIINCIGKSNLVTIHEALCHVYGSKEGQKIYKTVKAKSYPLTEQNFKRKDKIKHFADIISTHENTIFPDNFVNFLDKNKDKTKNLNGIRGAITKQYGNENGLKYYSAFKPYFKMISAMK